jgi:hypothetical protein
VTGAGKEGAIGAGGEFCETANSGSTGAKAGSGAAAGVSDGGIVAASGVSDGGIAAASGVSGGGAEALAGLARLPGAADLEAGRAIVRSAGAVMRGVRLLLLSMSPRCPAPCPLRCTQSL